MNIFRNGDKIYTVADIEKLEQKLAKANERIAELELALDGLADFLADKNKFAIEQQIDVLIGFAEYYECEAVKRGVARYIEQLRKEQ